MFFSSGLSQREKRKEGFQGDLFPCRGLRGGAPFRVIEASKIKYFSFKDKACFFDLKPVSFSEYDLDRFRKGVSSSAFE